MMVPALPKEVSAWSMCDVQRVMVSFLLLFHNPLYLALKVERFINFIICNLHTLGKGNGLTV